LTKNVKLLFHNSRKASSLACFLVALFAILSAPTLADAKRASIVVDANSGRILHATNVDTRNYPASLTKMMTLYIVFDALDSGELTLNSPFTVSRRATQQPPSSLNLAYRQTITAEQAILALVTKSANDVATVVAENLSGTERAFALRMTAKARKLGMSRTTFRNASGLPHRGQLSTARDMAKLARALLTHHAKYYGYFSTKHFKYKGRNYKNHNKLLTSYEGVDGIKTGYIRASGFNLVASAKRGNQRLIGVVLGGNSPNHRNKRMTSLLNKGFSALDRNHDRIADAAPAQALVAPPKGKPTTSTKTNLANLKKGYDWTVQVGAFAKSKQAYEAAQMAVDIAPNYLKKGLIKIVPISNRKGRTLHRARILGISKQQAYRACKSLKKNRMNCMEISGKNALRVASNN